MIEIKLGAEVLGDKAMVKKLAKLDHQGIPVALHRSLNKTNGKVRTKMSRSVTSRYAVKAERVKDEIPKSTFTKDSIKIKTGERGISLRQFKGRPVRKGYSAMVIKGKRAVIRKGFLIKQKKVNKPKSTVPFMRIGRSRHPIKPLYGPSVHSIFKGGRYGKQITKEVMKVGKETFNSELRGQINLAATGSR